MNEGKIITDECTNVIYGHVCEKECCVCKSQFPVYYYAFGTVFNCMITCYFCKVTLFIQGTDGYVGIAHLMKSVQYFIFLMLNMQA